ncbi:MAG: glycosyltransferase, partial [Acetatifactor sp.]|nr:glycosyltransferase [Acetatifactor sp.]
MKKKVSFVIPCYRSEHTVGHVVAEICETMKGLEQYDLEIILVNDCSPDGTWAAIRRLCQEDDRVRGINFARNFG